MFSILRPALVLFVLLTVVTGMIYPAIISGISLVAFRHQAEGSIVTVAGKQIGSELIAQPFTDAKYFWPRASAANYDATASAGSNLGPTNPALIDAVKSRVDALRAADASSNAAIPVDLVTASASGLDPHISVAAAQFQAPRIAKARSLSIDSVNRLIDSASESPLLGVLGDAKVNVLWLNTTLDQGLPAASVSSPGIFSLRGKAFMPE